MTNRLPITTLRIVLGLGLITSLALQVVVLPWMSGWMAEDYPEVAFMRWPVLALAVLGLVCVEVVLICIWHLLGAVQASEIFDPRSSGWVDAIVWALVAAAGLSFAAFLYLLMTAAGPISVPALALFATVAEVGMVTLMLVMRALLRQATTLQAEMNAVI